MGLGKNDSTFKKGVGELQTIEFSVSIRQMYGSYTKKCKLIEIWKKYGKIVMSHDGFTEGKVLHW